MDTILHLENAPRVQPYRTLQRVHIAPISVEVAPEELERAMTPEMARQFTDIFKKLGFLYVTLDLEGYRQGSLNAVLQQP